MSTVEFWQGEFGDEYHKRNAGADIEARVDLWDEILGCLDAGSSGNILEIGAGSGNNLRALRCLGHKSQELVGVEPNSRARGLLKRAGFSAYDGTVAYPGRTADLVFTSGVLIHISPSQLLPACQGIYNAARRYIVCIEYFSHEPVAVDYRGHAGKLWKRDFGGYWLDHFNVEPLGCGFAWKRMTGLDNLHWWAFRKC